MVFAARQHTLHDIGEVSEASPRLMRVEVIGLVRKEMAPAHFRSDVTFADVGPLYGGKAFGVSRRRQRAVEIDIDPRGDKIAPALVADAQAVDLLENARAVGMKDLARPMRRGARLGAFLLPRPQVRLARHVGQGIRTVLGPKRDLVDRHRREVRLHAYPVLRAVD